MKQKATNNIVVAFFWLNSDNVVVRTLYICYVKLWYK